MKPIIDSGTPIANNLYSATSEKVEYKFRLYEWEQTKFVSFYVDEISCVNFTLGNDSFSEISLRINSSHTIDFDDSSNRFEGYISKSCAVGSFYNSQGVKTYQGLKKDGFETGFGISFFDDDLMVPTIKYIGFYKHGMRHGVGILFDRIGDRKKIITKGNWLEGKIVKQTTFTIKNKSDLNRVSASIQNLKIEDNSLDNVLLTDLLSSFNKLKTLEIGNNCCRNVGALRIAHFPQLQSVVVGSGSFLPLISQSSKKTNYPHTLVFSDLPELQSIKIGKESFSWVKELNFSNLPKLETLEIGSVEAQPWEPIFGTFEWTINFKLFSTLFSSLSDA